MDGGISAAILTPRSGPLISSEKALQPRAFSVIISPMDARRITAAAHNYYTTAVDYAANSPEDYGEGWAGIDYAIDCLLDNDYETHGCDPDLDGGCPRLAHSKARYDASPALQALYTAMATRSRGQVYPDDSFCDEISVHRFERDLDADYFLFLFEAGA